MASTGNHTLKNTVVSIRIPAPGTPAAPIEAKITTMTIVNCCAIVRSTPKTCAINIATHA
jgi:hypothetical protein